MRAGFFIALLVMGACACAHTPAAGPDRAALQAAIHRWVAAVNARDFSTLTETMTGDVELLAANAEPTVGREAAAGALRALAMHGELTATTREITVVDDVAWHVAGLTQKQKNGDVRSLGQALEIWKRVDGAWKLHRRIALANAPGISLARPSPDEPALDGPAN